MRLTARVLVAIRRLGMAPIPRSGPVAFITNSGADNVHQPRQAGRKGSDMFAQYEDFQKFGKQGMDAALKNFGTRSKGF